MVAEHYAFWKSGGARCVLHVHGIVAVGLLPERPKLVFRPVCAHQKQLGGIVHPAEFFLSYIYHVPGLREAFALELSTLCGSQFRQKFINHIDIIAAGNSFGKA
ncbi:hypothetical protein SDC9_117188 [bioreactor metagenome]|uniref:Class II aldolase/adducin N-terminal domain-containing protein n=1 Tax=bioreactor metagenome TaxID=1076179 RepID=A0A645BYA2_9ZZZZ